MNTQEFTAIFQPCRKKLQRYALFLTRDEEDAKDLIQETAVRAFIHRHRFTPGTDFASWLHTIMRNAFINGYRRKRLSNRLMASLEDVRPNLENRPLANEAEALLWQKDLDRILEDLPDMYQSTFMMFYRGYQYHEIAEQMDIPLGTVKSRIFWTRKLLRKRLRHLYAGRV